MLQKLFNKRILISLCTIIVLILVVRSCSKKENTEFPKIKIGTYNGELKIKKVSYPFLISNTETLTTLVIASLGLAPKKIDLTNFRIDLEGKSYNLVGQKLEREYFGEVLLDKKTVGTWKLKKIKALTKTEVKDPELNEVIKNYYILRTEAKSLREEEIDLKARIEGYKNAIPKEESIRNVALNEIEDLKYSLEEKQNTKKNLNKEIRNHVKDLEQLQRITTLGRVVDLARRTTKREDRWYLANWGEEGIDESQQQVADSLGLDLEVLGEKLKLAEEYINLKNSINFEARKIDEIKNTKLRPKIPNAEQEQQDPQPDTETPRSNDKSFWNKIGDVFGL